MRLDGDNNRAMHTNNSVKTTYIGTKSDNNSPDADNIGAGAGQHQAIVGWQWPSQPFLEALLSDSTALLSDSTALLSASGVLLSDTTALLSDTTALLSASSPLQAYIALLLYAYGLM